jgi:hypothetical protein
MEATVQKVVKAKVEAKAVVVLDLRSLLAVPGQAAAIHAVASPYL